MPKFQMNGKNDPEFQKLDEFTQGYIEAMFFTENCQGVSSKEWAATEADRREGRLEGRYSGEFPDDCGFADLHPDSLVRIVKECRKFQDDQSSYIEVALEIGDPRKKRELDMASAGHDFWYTRQRHGCGFWDGDWPEPYAAMLTAAAKDFGECYVVFGDDNKIHIQ